MRGLSRLVDYCFFSWHTLDAACQSPPALSQSALFMIFEKSAGEADGLAEGDVVDELLEESEPLLEVPGLLGMLLAPPAPVGLLVLGLLGLLGLLWLLVWAATIAGAKATSMIRTKNSAFFI